MEVGLPWFVSGRWVTGQCVTEHQFITEHNGMVFTEHFLPLPPLSSPPFLLSTTPLLSLPPQDVSR